MPGPADFVTIPATALHELVKKLTEKPVKHPPSGGSSGSTRNNFN